jgi:hypothetical protein
MRKMGFSERNLQVVNKSPLLGMTIASILCYGVFRMTCLEGGWLVRAVVALWFNYLADVDRAAGM